MKDMAKRLWSEIFNGDEDFEIRQSVIDAINTREGFGDIITGYMTLEDEKMICEANNGWADINEELCLLAEQWLDDHPNKVYEMKYAPKNYTDMITEWLETYETPEEGDFLEMIDGMINKILNNKEDK